VQVGDRLVTSGLGGRFPAGFPVGEILSISTDSSSLFAAAKARPSAALDRSGDVLLLRDQPQPYGAPAPVDDVGPPRDLAGPAPSDPKPAAPPQPPEPSQ
jgi:rod shape-determining protein MreC